MRFLTMVAAAALLSGCGALPYLGVALGAATAAANLGTETLKFVDDEKNCPAPAETPPPHEP